MLPKTLLKQIAQLGQKKFRDQSHCFVVEGQKSVRDFYDQRWEWEGLYATTPQEDLPFTQISLAEMGRITQFKTPSPVLGVFKKQKELLLPENESVLVLDQIRDPGNLGTIIRQASWFGFQHVLCSKDSVDCYNPKVVQASMGGLARVACHYGDLISFLSQTQLAVYGAGLEGKSIYKHSFKTPAAIVFGSESHGFSPAVAATIQEWITIPSVHAKSVESLNIASASAIVLSAFAQS